LPGFFVPGWVSFAFHGRNPHMPRTAQQARIAALARHRPPDDPELLEARRDYWATEIAAHVEKVVTQAAPLTEQQIGRIVSILANAPRGSEPG
jgi:hypothetical protein